MNAINVSVCIILILIVAHTAWPKYVYNPMYGQLKISEISHDVLETGDIIFMKNCPTCKLSSNVLNNMWQMSGKKTFNSFRWYVNDIHYTHVAIVLRINNIPYICHIDGGDPMFDALEKQYMPKKLTVSDLSHVDVRGGPIHLFRYIGPEITSDMSQWIDKNRGVCYPPSNVKLVMANGLQWCKNPEKKMACTDFVEHTLNFLSILPYEPTQNATLKGLHTFIHASNVYDSIPIILNNKCQKQKHFL
jgi:hypothetical protein